MGSLQSLSGSNVYSGLITESQGYINNIAGNGGVLRITGGITNKLVAILGILKLLCRVTFLASFYGG